MENKKKRVRRGPNPYMDMSLSELAERCMLAASAIDKALSHSDHWRAQLDEKLYLLLIAVSGRLCGSKVDYKSPEFNSTVKEKGGAREVFARYSRIEQAAVRRTSFQRCAEAILGHQAINWIGKATIDGRPVLDVAEASDEGLDRALHLIPETYDPRRQ
jgi:hypothetical protein